MFASFNLDVNPKIPVWKFLLWALHFSFVPLKCDYPRKDNTVLLAL